MNVIAYIFSFLCSQDPIRSFTIAGHLMPLCQRCTGLYVGMGLSFFWLLISHNHKKGLLTLSIVCVNIMCLLAMPIFGFHLLDPGPAWRLWSGLIYGNAIVSLLLPAALIIYSKNRKFIDHTNPSITSFWIFFAFLNSIPIWFPIQSSWFYFVVLLLIFVGLLCVVFGVSIVAVSIITRFAKSAILKGFYYELS